MVSFRELFDLEGEIIKKRRKILDKRLEKEDLFFGQPKILRFIEKKGECDQNAIVRELNCSKASVTYSVKRLEKAGLIKRETAREDMRRNIISLTELGRRKAQKAEGILTETVEGQFKDFTREEREMIYRLYKKILSNLGEQL